MVQRILVVDDDTALAEMIGIVLQGERFEPLHCAHGSEALEVFRAATPDLVLLDVMLPGVNGVDVCRQIRAESGTPIIMLTARSDTTDVVRGLEAGADDYVVKPFNPTELLARIRARLREPSLETGAVHTSSHEGGRSGTLTVADLTIDLAAHTVTRGEHPVTLTPLEFDLLTTMAKQPDRAFTRAELLADVWGYEYDADTRLVNVHVQRLRAKIEHDPEQPTIIATVRGVGYRACSKP